MKYEKEATTKNGRRTWKVTYELVRGPEPKPKHSGARTASNQTPKKAEKSKAKPPLPINSQPNERAPPQLPSKKRKAEGDGSQLGMF